MLSLALVATEPDLPLALPFERYQAMAERSPFALATPSVKSPEESAPFAANLYVTGLGRIGDTDCAFIASRDQQKRYVLVAGEPGPDGLTLSSIAWSDQVGKSRITISKSGEIGVLEFDQAVIQAPPAPINAQGELNAPPLANPVIGVPQNGNVSPRRPGETRRRIRVIPSRPQ